MTGTGRRWLRATDTSWVLEFSDGSTVQSPPVAEFTYTVSGLVVAFDGAESFSTSGAITAYSWDFGDAVTSTASAPTHTYKAGGTFTVRLSVTDAKGGTDSTSQTVVLSSAPPTNKPPTASFTATVTAGSTTVSFNGAGSADTDGSVTRYDWTFGDAGTGSGVSVTHNYPSVSATYTVTLTVTDNLGSTGVASKQITVGTPVIPKFSHVIDVWMENHSDTQIYGSASAPYINSLAAGSAKFTNAQAIGHPSQPNYIAAFSGGTQGVTDDNNHDLGAITNLYSQLVAAGKTMKGYVEATGVRKHNPWESFSNATGCEADFSTFPTTANLATLPALCWVVPNLTDDMHDGTVTQGDTWLQAHIDPVIQWAKTNNSLVIIRWDEDDSNSANGNDVPVILAGANVVTGVYTQAITHYDLLGLCEDVFGVSRLGLAASTPQLTYPFTSPPPTPTNQPPVAAFTSTVSGAVVAFNGSGSSDPDGSVKSYAWVFGDGSTGTGQSPSYTYKAAGTYTVTLTVTDDKGATGAVSHSVTPAISAPPPPPPPPSGSGGDNGGSGVTPSGAGIVSYNSLSGTEFSARVNTGGTNKVALPPGTYSFRDFSFNGGGTPPTQFWFGAKITTSGLLGAGSKYTSIQMTASTSTKASDVPAQGTNLSNQLQYIYINTANPVVDGVKIVGTTQGHLYNGLRFDHNASPTFTNCTITGIPGNASSPPGETFGVNFQGSTGTATVSNITFDGQNIEACGFGSNSASAHFVIHNVYCVNLKYSAGWASWQQTGAMEFYNFVTKNSARSFNAERLVSHVQFFDPVWDQPLVGHDLNLTYETGWVGGTIDFRFTDQAAWNAFVANRTTKKIMPISNPSSVSLGLSKANSIKVYIANVLQTQANYVAWQGI